MAKEVECLYKGHGIRSIVFYDDALFPNRANVNNDMTVLADLISKSAPDAPGVNEATTQDTSKAYQWGGISNTSAQMIPINVNLGEMLVAGNLIAVRTACFWRVSPILPNITSSHFDTKLKV